MSNSSNSASTRDSSQINSIDLPLLIIVDGHSLAFRSFYAFAVSRQGVLRTSEGIPTSVCFGFINSLVQVIESQQPQFLAIAFDLGVPTFRHQADPNYKADRKETPEDFIVDIKNLQQLLAALNIATVTSPGYEADDIIATLTQQASNSGYQVKILSGDRDLFQLVDRDKNVSVLYLDNQAIKSASGSYSEFSPEAVEAKLGIKPHQVVDYKALCGDKSDNIPGVKGIGEKTAVKLLKEYETLDAVYQNLDRIQGAVKKKLEEGKEEAKRSQHLAQLVYNVPIQISLAEFELKGFDVEVLTPLLQKLELNKFLRQINKLQQRFGGSLKVVANELDVSEEKGESITQLSLFEDRPSTNSASKLENTSTSKNAIVIEPQIIDTETKLKTLVTLLKKHKNLSQPVAWDTETTSLEPHEADLVGIGCCWGDRIDEIAYIPTSHTKGNHLDKQLVLEALRPILESDIYPKTLQNAKFDRLILLHQGINLTGVVFDTMLASYVLNPEKSHKLSDICRNYGVAAIAKDYADLNIPKGKSIADLDIAAVAEYCGLDVCATYKLTTRLQAELAKNADLDRLLLEVEIPLELVLAEMEERGIALDIAYLKELSEQLEQNLLEIKNNIYADANEKFNIDSPKQLGEILFEKLKLDKRKTRKTKTGYSTNHATLEKLQGDHPIIDRLLDYRTLAKLKSTYVDSLPNLVRPDTHRVHTDFNQTNTATGRLSSSNPNLQNIPIRTEFSRQIRRAFIPEDNWMLVSADYSQIELRILTHLTQEPILLDAYRKEEDVHSITAKLIFEKDTVTSEERRLGKIINFGVIYGMGSHRFARESGLTAKIGKDFIDKYRAKYAKIFAYLEGVKKEAVANGFVTTILGRRRYFNFESKELQQLKGRPVEEIDLETVDYSYYDAQLLRAAANAPIQGSSADIIKIAMVKLRQILQKYQAHLLLQVHDELVFEIPQEELSELQPQIQTTMENALKLSVPLVVDLSAGKNWMEAK
jgi:DNA polymerase-1